MSADLAERMVPAACELACLARDWDADGISSFLAARTPAEMDALAVVLAAMIPVDRGVADLLAWADDDPDDGDPVPVLADWGRDLRPCGTYAAHRRHLRRGEPVDPACDRAWRAYRAERYRQRKGGERHAA